jgi:hypothetical protein
MTWERTGMKCMFLMSGRENETRPPSLWIPQELMVVKL